MAVFERDSISHDQINIIEEERKVVDQQSKSEWDVGEGSLLYHCACSMKIIVKREQEEWLKYIWFYHPGETAASRGEACEKV
jgi:hypothetical protein